VAETLEILRHDHERWLAERAAAEVEATDGTAQA
jgi:hypothetical protein